MYLDFKDYCRILLESLLIAIIVVGLFIFNYYLGSVYCEIANVPKDLTLTVMSPTIIVDFTFGLLMLEIMLFICIVNQFKLLIYTKK